MRVYELSRPQRERAMEIESFSRLKRTQNLIENMNSTIIDIEYLLPFIRINEKLKNIPEVKRYFLRAD